jgi:hypothetical protein
MGSITINIGAHLSLNRSVGDRLGVLASALLLTASMCGAQASAAKDSHRSIAAAYREHYIGQVPSRLAVTPDLVAEHCLEISLFLAEILNSERRTLLLEALGPQGGAQVRDESSVRGLSPAFTPVWGNSVDDDLEWLLVTVREGGWQAVSMQLAPWSRLGVGLWGNGGGLNPGYSPVQGGLSDEETALNQLATRIRLGRGVGVVGGVLHTISKHGEYSDVHIVDLLRALEGWQASWRDTTPGWMQSLSSDIAVSGAERTWRELGQCSRDIRQLCRRVKTGPAAQHTGLELRLHLLEGWAVECAVACDIAVKAIRANKRDTQGSDKTFFARVLEVRASVSAGLKKPSAELQVLEHVEEIGGVKYLAFCWGQRGHR